MSRSAFLLVLALVLPACGEDPPEERPAYTPYKGPGQTGLGADSGRVAQEIWITYGDRAKALFPSRPPRDREEAQRVAGELRERVLRGEDIGLLAQTASDSPLARADGFSGPLPRDRKSPDARDRAILAVREGEVTPLVEWDGGFWFAKRIGLDHGARLQRLLDGLVSQGKTAQLDRVRARLIHFHHAGAWPSRFEADGISKEQAIESAWGAIRELQRGADFAAMARERSWDESGDRGGVLLAYDPLGQRSPWLMRYDTGYTDTLLRILFDPATRVGLYPEPVVTARGVHVVELLERKQVTREEIEASRVPAPAQPPKERTPGAR